MPAPLPTAPAFRFASGGRSTIDAGAASARDEGGTVSGLRYGSGMDREVLVRRIGEGVVAGTVFENPGRGTSTVVWNDGERVCYLRTRSRLYVRIEDLADAAATFAGRTVRTTDLKAFRPAVFDSRANGHGCHCTFLFRVLQSLGLAGEVTGTGRRGSPFAVTVAGREAVERGGTPAEIPASVGATLS